MWIGLKKSRRSGRRPDLVRARMNLDLERHLAVENSARFLVFEFDRRTEFRTSDVLQRWREQELWSIAVVFLRLGLGQLLL